MLIKVFPHGQGGGSGPVDYLLRMDYPGRSEGPPTLLRGDADMTRDLIDAQPRKWKFTAGVCSWGPEDTVTPEQERQLMDDFERLAFAGLEPDQYNILWVRHSHAGHHELHFVIPRVELSTGKAFNAFPPGWRKDFDQLRDLYNWRENWTRPDDPARARFSTPDHADLHKARLIRWGKEPKPDARAEAKSAVHDYVRAMMESGQVHDRDSLIKALTDAGLEINRAGKDYVTVKDADSGEKLRLKGGVYAADWQLGQPGRTNEGESRTGAATDRDHRRRRIDELAAELERRHAKRAQYNQKRYGRRDQKRQMDAQRPDANPVLEFRPTLVDGQPDRPGRDHRRNPGRLGPDQAGGTKSPKPAPGNIPTSRPAETIGNNRQPTRSQNLGPGIAGGPGGPLHRPAAQHYGQNRLDAGQTPGHKSGVTHEPVRTQDHRYGAIESHDRRQQPASPENQPRPGSALGQTNRIREAVDALERTLHALAAAYRQYQQRRQQEAAMKGAQRTAPYIGQSR